MGTVTISAVDYNIYGTSSDADDYLNARLDAAVNWAAEDADTKARALVSGTRSIRQFLEVRGAELDPAGSVDTEIEQANYELAYELTQDSDILNQSSMTTTEKRLKAGSAEVEYFRGTRGGRFPVTVMNILNNWLDANGYGLDVAMAAYGTSEESTLDSTDYDTQYP